LEVTISVGGLVRRTKQGFLLPQTLNWSIKLTNTLDVQINELVFVENYPTHYPLMKYLTSSVKSLFGKWVASLMK
jgi:hypothetical protein